MKKAIVILIMAWATLSCGAPFYTKEIPTQTTGVDFSNGKWLLGDIKVDSDFKADFTQLVLNDFSKHIPDRITSSFNQKSLLLPQSVPLNPSKSVIMDLKKGSNYDYYINIKCADQRSHSEKDLTESFYYTKNMTFAVVQLEIYDLNSGTIIYSQRVRGSYDEHSSTNPKPAKKLTFGCYQRIINDIDKKS